MFKERIFDLFEQCVMTTLSAIIMLIASVSLLHLTVSIVVMLADRGINSTTPENLQAVFGMFFTILIALEFKRSFITPSAGKQHGIIRIEPILLIGILATVRKFIVLDLKEIDFNEMLGLSAAILSLGLVYWFIQPRYQPQPPALQSDNF
ncbi:MAG: phosphate-starvation-inducible PsiE family protein [Acetobacter aceti]|jgi:uncharacterized membrane protein (DUF373 family)|uniref:Protein PsiE n=3 Tax=Acetobacteraceae TaxID=433 RepID=A0A1U9KJD8_ACEAC|nr:MULTISPECIES: phosphate-starvation-inducible PsiE family protein [Acetobacteraceae]AQS85858.1 hypothetical protein A0U92_14985 [Acetobacter aceti]KXV50065.1 hypothetical protein AD945_02780 [Gluconobacter albidus]MDF3626030.1 phosphate-starvation-inducible PsiE family protein [Brytella acorum]CAI9122303.1 phosphate-starvation-inducible PsiE family protein [Brytella acorum]